MKLKLKLFFALLIVVTFSATAQNFSWAKAMVGTGTTDESSQSVAIDAAGNVYTTGLFFGTVDFDPGASTFNLTSNGLEDIFISKLDASGNFLWAKKIGGTGTEIGWRIALDASSNVVVSGYFRNTVDFDPGSGTVNLVSSGGFADIFVLKLDTNGNFIWVKQFGASSVDDDAIGLYIDNLSNVYITGYFNGTVDFDPGVGISNLTPTGSSDIYILKLDASGSFVWAKKMGGTLVDQGRGIYVDGLGNVFTVGVFRGTADVDPGASTINLTSAGSDDIFISKLDASGNFNWAKSIGSTGIDFAYSISVDASGNIFISGHFNGTVDFDPGVGISNLTSAGGDDIFVCKLDATGNYSWAKRMGSASTDIAYASIVDASGNFQMTGIFSGTVDFDPGATTTNFTSAGLTDIFVCTLDASGNFLRAKTIGGIGNDAGKSIAVSSSGSSYISGDYSGTVDFDPSASTFNLSSGGGKDIFVMKFLAPCNITNSGSQTNLTCNGICTGSATMIPSGGTSPYTYSWAPSGGSAATANSLCAGSYTCTVTDNVGCTSTRTYTLTQPPAISVGASLQSNVICNGGNNGAASVNASGGTGTLTYNWTPGNPTGDGTASVSGLTAGTWTCTVTDANGCIGSRIFTITQPPAIAVSIASQTNTTCNGGTNGAASVTASGGVGILAYDWMPGNPTGDGTNSITGIFANTWTCNVSDENGCTASQAITITQPPAISVLTASISPPSCNGGNNGSASVSASGGTGSLSYNWTPGNPTGDGTTSVSGLTAGSWTCTVTDGSGCTGARTINLTQPTAISVAAVSQTNVSCNGGSNGSASASATGGTGTLSFNWTPYGGAASTATGLTAGTYTCTVTDANTCAATRIFTITQPTAIVVNAVSQTNVSCNAGNNGAATISASGGTGAFTYNWTPFGGTGITASALIAGTYTCTVTDANACLASRTFTITQPTAIVVNAVSQTNVSCNAGSNGAATISASGGTGAFTYNWMPGNPTGDGTVSVSGLTAGSWTCTVTDANACSASRIITITQPTPISVGISSQTNVSCNGGSNGAASIFASGGTGTLTYNWTPGNPTGDGTASVSGLTVGSWTCTVTDANGCNSTQTFTITQPTVITISATAQSNVSCNGGNNGTITVNATGGTGAFTYNWTPSGGTGITATGLIAGTYTCTVTDANLCTAARSFTITQPTAVVVNAVSQTNVSCNAGSNGAATISASGGTGAYTYNWTPGNPTGDGTVSVTGLTAGSWTCTVTDANACSASRIITITEPTAISVVAVSQINVSCNGGSNGTAAVSASGGTGAFSYNWTPGNPTGDGTASVTGLSAGSWTCTVTDANGCAASRTFTITQPSVIVVNAVSQTNVSCNAGNNGAATISASGGTGAFTYNWTPSGGTGMTATGLIAGTYTCTVTDANLCTASRSFTITQPTAIVVNAVSQTNVSCNAGSNGAATILASGGTGAFTYNWTPGNPTGDGTVSVTGLTAGSWTCTVTDANACSASRTFTITEPTPISVIAVSQTNVSCNAGNNGAAPISASGGTGAYTYNWTPGNPTGDGTASVTGLSAGSWTCTVTDANACSALSIITITEPAAISVAAVSQTNVSCSGGSNGSATASAAGGTGTLSFNWTPYGGTASTAAGLTAGTYTCTVTDANACLAIRTFTITEPTAISIVSVSQTNVSCNAGNNGAATISASGGTGAYTYNWTPFGGTGISAAGLIAGTYTCTVTDANLCSSSLIFSITEPTAISVTIVSQTNVSCNAGNNGAATISASGGTGAFTYNWTPGNPTGDGTASVSELSAGSFTCTVTDENGCSAFRIITITEPTPISVGVSSQTNVSCNGGTTGSASVFASGGTGSISFNWLPFGGASAFATGLSAGTYSCNISDANGCSAIQLFTISEPTAILVAPVSQTNISCNDGNNGAAAVSASGGTGVLLFNWVPSGGSAPAITGLTADTYTCTVSDENGCSATQTFIITEPSQIIVSPSSQNNVSCNGGSNGDASASATGGTGLLSYSWTPFGGSTSSATGLTAGIYTVTATDENGCTSSVQFDISEPTTIVVNTVSQTNNLCNGGNNGTAAISVSGGIAGYTYDWTPGNPTGDASNSISNLTAGNWNCSVTDANGCVTSHAVSITEPPAIIINQSNIICAGASITVGVNTYSISGVYTDVLIAANGCDSTVTTNLTVNPALSTSQTIVRCAGESVTVGVNTYSTSGVYTDILIAANGCDSTVTTNLTVNPAISGSQTIVRCAGESITVGLNTYSISGIYTDVLTAANGCDSTVTTNLTVKPSINIATSLSGTTITAVANPATYQWIDCTNSNVIIAGATNQSYISTVNGSYAVIVTQNGCSDTSACVSITNTGINGSIQNSELLIYPNPANDKVIIELGNLIGEYLKIMNAIGQVVYDAEIKNTKIEIDLSVFANGIYTIQVQTAKGIVLKKLVKN